MFVFFLRKVEDMVFGISEIWIWILVLMLLSFVILGKVNSFFELRFFYFKDGVNNRIDFIMFFWGLKKMYIKGLVEGIVKIDKKLGIIIIINKWIKMMVIR